MEETQLDVAYIKDRIQEILDKSHSESEKRRIMPMSSSSRDIQFACPVCGDSRKKMHEKRGHIYLNSLRFRCYNEQCHVGTPTFTALCKRFNIQLDPGKKLDIINYVNENIQYRPSEDDYMSASMDKLLHIDDLKRVFNDGTSELTNFQPVQKNSKAYWHLKNRKINPNDETFWEATRWITPNWSEYVIVFLNRRGDNVLGMQTRNLKKEKEKRYFKIYNFEMLYNIIHPDDPIDEAEAIIYNKLSYFFNILNIDFERTITVFEGYTDSKFYPNSIGLVGLDTDLDFLMKSGADLQFFYDYDKPGMWNTLKMLNKGEKVFLWEKLFENLIEGKKDPYELYQKLIKIKDLNRLAEIVNDPYNSLKLHKYFSIDIFDKKYINFDNF
jgi:hypothetical protein